MAGTNRFEQLALAMANGLSGPAAAASYLEHQRRLLEEAVHAGRVDAAEAQRLHEQLDAAERALQRRGKTTGDDPSS